MLQKTHVLLWLLVSLLDVMEVNLVNMDLFTGQWISATKEDSRDFTSLNLGSYLVKNHGASLLDEKCELKLQVERNLSVHIHKSGKFIAYFLESINRN